MKKKETKLQELERRIKYLEDRNVQITPQYFPPYTYPPQIPYGFSRCSMCGAIYSGFHTCIGNYPITYC